MFAIFALVWARSVRMPASAPVKEMALPPSAFTAIAVSAIAACSPVASNASSSRSAGLRRNFTRQLDQIIGRRPPWRRSPRRLGNRSAGFRSDARATLRIRSGVANGSAAVLLDDQAHAPAQLNEAVARVEGNFETRKLGRRSRRLMNQEKRKAGKEEMFFGFLFWPRIRKSIPVSAS